MSVARVAIFWGSTLLFFAVLIGAFGAHALAPLLEQNQRLDVFETASRYHFYHGIGLLFVGVLITSEITLVHARWIVFLLLFGTVLFSGSLYCLAVFEISWLGMITPIGGVLLLGAWWMIMSALFKLSRSNYSKRTLP